MTPAAFLSDMVRPGLRDLHVMGGPRHTTEAERFLVAIAGQESDWTHRYQHSPRAQPGPARGWWQFEQIGVAGVLRHRSSGDLARRVLDRHHIVPHKAAAWRALECNDMFAVQIARLLIRTEPRALPVDADEGWRQYLNLWRPGRPRQERWQQRWQAADDATRGGVAPHTGV